MWFITDPEALRVYQYKGTLRKAREETLRRYAYTGLIGPGTLWYTGISSNPLLSLAAHGVDRSDSKRFACWVIPAHFARELKAAALALDGFRHVSDDTSDYVAAELPYTYLYNFLVEKHHVLSIDPAGFTPLRYIPARPAQVFVWRPDGTRTARRIETADRDRYPEILQGLLERARVGEIERLLLRCQEATIMQCDFRPDGYDLYYDARTSQSGYVYRYLPEDAGDWGRLYDLLLYFLRFYKKQRGSKWKYLRKELASDHMRFLNGMLCEE